MRGKIVALPGCTVVTVDGEAVHGQVSRLAFDLTLEFVPDPRLGPAFVGPAEVCVRCGLPAHTRRYPALDAIFHDCGECGITWEEGKTW